MNEIEIAKSLLLDKKYKNVGYLCSDKNETVLANPCPICETYHHHAKIPYYHIERETTDSINYYLCNGIKVELRLQYL